MNAIESGMGLNGHVRCRCIQDGLAKPHLFPARLALDDTIEPFLTGNPPLDDWVAHDRWFSESCEHGGYIVSERLGNIAMIAHVRELVGNIERTHSLHFPISGEKVIYNGTHTGDHISATQAVKLLKESEAILQSGNVVEAIDRDFFESVRRLCDASISTKNPIVF